MSPINPIIIDDQQSTSKVTPIHLSQATSSKKKRKGALTKIYTGLVPNEDKVSNIRDILIYDIPATRIALSTFTVASFDRSTVWQYELGGLLVQWFPGRWTLAQRKQREMFQAIVRDVPVSFAMTPLLRKD